MSYLKRLWRRFRSLAIWQQIGATLILIALIIISVHFVTRGSSGASTDAASGISHVQLESVASLSSPSGPLPVVGKVSSQSQATILAQTSGEITALNVSLGSQVGAGQIIAEFSNASQQAAVLQAQGQYNAAQAALATAQDTTATNSSLSSSQAANAAQTAGTSATAAMQSAYAALDDAVHTKADTLFTNPRSTTITPTFNLTIPDNQLQVNIINEREGLDATIADASAQANNASGSVDDRITAITNDAQAVASFLNNMVQATNEAEVTQTTSAAQIAAAQASMSAARTEVVSAIASLASAKSAYDAAQTSSQTAANTAGSGTQNSIAAAQAQVQVALGSLDAAKAALENTIVRSPISGTIVSLPVTQGTYVSAYSQVAQVSNPNALEIDTYVTSDDAKTLAVGGKAAIEGGATGVITSIAPAIDPTSGKIEVKIGITGNQSSLTDGETVTVSLQRSAVASTAQNAASSQITIPLNAVKITPQGPIVFTISSTTLVANAITLGTILGDQVVIASGVTPEMDIVTDARGLSAGQTVIVDTQ